MKAPGQSISLNSPARKGGLLNNFLPSRWLFIGALVSWLGAAHASADTIVPRRWATTAPTINGVVAPGEWSAATATPLAHGQMRTFNDANYLYVLLDVVDDTANNPPAGSGPNTGDWFGLWFDVDLNNAITPHVDFRYATCNDGTAFSKSYRISQFTSTGCQSVDPQSLGAIGFGPTFNSATPHRFWEFRLSFEEIGVDPSTWTTAAGSNPKVRYNVTTRSEVPAFDTHQPTLTSHPDLSNLFQVDLAILPIFPPGSTGPVFAGVGLVPANYITSDGYANINIAGYYYATNAPFGGNLNIFGNWFSLRYLYGASKYRILYSKDGGPFTRLRQTWTNFKFNGTTWVPNAIGPDANDAYAVPSLFELWYLPNLLVSWQSGLFGDGTFTFRLELLNASGTVLASPPGNSLRLFVVNTAPAVTINSISYNGTDICECGIVTQGSAPLGFTFNVTVNDPNGALNSFDLGATYGNNHSLSIYSDSYVPGHINEDGPRRWNGVSNLTIPARGSWRAATACAYSFILSASSRVQNGYGLIFPHVQAHNNLTILLGVGAGSTDCP